MTRSLLVAAIGVLASCSYDFGGGGDGGATSATDASASSGTGDATASTAEGTATSASSTTDAASATASSAEASSSSGVVALTPCVQDDFDSFDTSGPPAGWTTIGGTISPVMGAGGGVVVVGSTGTDGAYITMPMHPSNCYISISFTVTTGNPNVYLDVRHDGDNVVALGLLSSNMVSFGVRNQGMTTSQEVPGVQVDALALVFAEPSITAYQRSTGGIWTKVGNPQALPTWFTDDPVDTTGFGLVNSLTGSTFFYDFSIVAPPAS